MRLIDNFKNAVSYEIEVSVCEKICYNVTVISSFACSPLQISRVFPMHCGMPVQ